MKKIESSKFKNWLSKLKDETVKARIVARVNRLMEGLAGDVAPIGYGVSELRIHCGPGYRVYFYQQGDILVLLLSGGDKSTQDKDIVVAHKILKEWREQNG
jgi:putative addiction module killer protein